MERKNKTIVGDVIEDVSFRVSGVSVLWGVIPGSVVAVFIIFFLFVLIGVDVNTDIPTEKCDSIRNTGIKPVYNSRGVDITPRIKVNCVQVLQSGYWKLLLIPISMMVGVGVGKWTYMLALANANRKASAGLAGTYMLKNIWNM
jgi:hypothetical protein